jgi:hypothetical protein
MIEEFATVVIRELGATGLLLVGLYVILLKAVNKISKPLEVINHNSTELLQLVKIYIKKNQCDQNGKN